jgi:hypothetical protein
VSAVTRNERWPDVLADPRPRHAGKVEQRNAAVAQVVGENVGTPAAVQARVKVVRKRSAPKPWNTRRSGVRS